MLKGLKCDTSVLAFAHLMITMLKMLDALHNASASYCVYDPEF
jgi:hypothetical protein